MTTPIFCFPEFALPCKKSVHSINSFLRYSQFLSPLTRLATHISPHANQKFFGQLFVYMNLYQHAKNQAISLTCSGDMVDSKILESNWMRTLWHISKEPEFSQIWDLCRHTANNINFHYRRNSVETNDKIFQYIQKLYFWPIFPIFGKKNFFSGKSGHHAQLHMGF